MEDRIIFGKWKPSKRHNWERCEDGSINTFAWDSETHNGAWCTFCGASSCVFCHPDWLEKAGECTSLHFECSVCGAFSESGTEETCPNCHASMTVRVSYPTDKE